MGSFAAGAGTQFVVTSGTGGGTFPGPFTVAAGTATANTPALNVTQTWNNAAVTFTGWRFNVTDTASNAASLLLNLQVGGSSRFNVRKDGRLWSGAVSTSGSYSSNNFSLILKQEVGDASLIGLHAQSGGIFCVQSGGAIGFSTSADSAGSLDVILRRDAANTLAQRNGTAAQTFNIYNTFTDASNYSRLAIIVGSRIDIVPEWAGTGASRNVRLGLGNNGTAYTSFIQGRGVNEIGLSTGGAVDNWIFSGTASFLNDYEFNSDVTIGARVVAGGNSNFGAPHLKLQGGAGTGNGRGAEVYAVGSLSGASGTTQQAIYELFRGYILAANQQMFSFGGKTASFPALKRNATFLETKLADDSAYAPHAMQYLDVTDGITAPASASGRARIYVDTADGDLKVVFGDGTVKTIVTDTP